MATTLATEPLWTIDRDDVAGIVFIRSPHCDAIEPGDWREQFIAALRRNPGAAVVGPKRLDDRGNVFSMGDHVVHPKGFHFLGKGEPATSFRFPEECDAITGGLLAIDADHFDAIDGPSLCQGELGPLTLCLAIRQRGGRCITLPSVVATDAHSPSPSPEEERAFEQRFGFDWLAADLDAIPAGSPLLWNPRYQGVAMPFEKYEQREAMHWTSYATVAAYRQRADHIAGIFDHFTSGSTSGGAGDTVLDLGCGDGLFTHLAALKGLAAIGIDPEPAAIDHAKAQCSTQTYPAQPPRFDLGVGSRLPYADATFRMVSMLDVIEHLPNPVRVLREAARVLQPAGHLLITTPAWQFGRWSDPTYHVTEYTAEELTRQVTAATRHHHALKPAHLGKIGGIYRDLVLIAQRQD